MNRLLLPLLAAPTLWSSAICYLTVLQPVSAAEVPSSTRSLEELDCVKNPHGQQSLVCVRVQVQPGVSPQQAITEAKTQPLDRDDSKLEFSEEESDAAIALFGCDCPICINALRSLRNLPPIS